MRCRLLAAVFTCAMSWGQQAPEGWSAWSARPETAPRVFIDQVVDRGSGGSLAISGNSNPAAHGGWQKKVDGVGAGKWYRLRAFWRASGVAAENWQVVARLDWRNAQGKRAGQPEYVWRQRGAGEWKENWVEAPAPAGATSVLIQLFLSNAPQGTVWWDDITFEEIPDPGPRNVTIASINLKPSRTSSAAESVSKFMEAVDQLVKVKADLIVLPEGITVVGTGKTYAEVAEALPGPTTERLGVLAKARGAYIVAGVYEREGAVVYNTAVLLDRQGRLAGKYRKVYLPREEVEAGITPGAEYPVFRTDFGVLGMMICYDVFFADPARALVLGGAEIIALPIWGGDETLAKARAIEGGVFLVASGYDHPTYVMDPDGRRIAVAKDRGSAAIATIDLNRRYADAWLGEMHGRRLKEMRLDVSAEALR
ncbi:MAG: carbon-nitrogen hydrolase family protein [Candidatus Solibacter usitatus]|nr:carbon-nitrogen hydrolase family protein [Candidatus Solibacter usitatus]